MKIFMKRKCLNCDYVGKESVESGKEPDEIIDCPVCGSECVDGFYYQYFKDRDTKRKVSSLKQYDVQRVESLMRYAEFLTDFGGQEEKVSRVLDLIHYEVGGYVELVDEVVTAYANDVVVEKACSLHPDVKEFISQEVKRQTTVQLDGKKIAEAIRKGLDKNE